MNNKKKHIQNQERFLIEKMLKINKSFGYISKLLDRGVSTISEEVNRNGGREVYSSNKAQLEANKRQLEKKLGSNKILNDRKIEKLVNEYLNQGHSPELVSKMLKKRSLKLYASTKSIRKYIKQMRTS